MSSIHKQPKKTKAKQSPTYQSNNIADELKLVIKSLNQFLKKHFEKAVTAIEDYAGLVKEYFIEESTNSSYHCLIGSLFSKISNMLQPFIQPKAIQDRSQYKLKEEISYMTHKIQKYRNKIRSLKGQLNNYMEINTRLTNFVYMLRVNNIDVDLLYQKGCEIPSKRQSNLYQNDLEQESKTEYLRNKEIGLQNFQTQ